MRYKALSLCLLIILSTVAACSSSDGLTGRTISILDIIGNNATVTKADAKEMGAGRNGRREVDAGTGKVSYGQREGKFP